MIADAVGLRDTCAGAYHDDAAADNLVTDWGVDRRKDFEPAWGGGRRAAAERGARAAVAAEGGPAL